jgi:hypothetical protein
MSLLDQLARDSGPVAVNEVVPALERRRMAGIADQHRAKRTVDPSHHQDRQIVVDRTVRRDSESRPLAVLHQPPVRGKPGAPLRPGKLCGLAIRERGARNLLQEC